MNLYVRIRQLLKQNRTHERDAQESQGNSPPVIRAELHLPDSVIQHYEAKQKNEGGTKTWKRYIDVATLTLGVAGFLVLLGTLCETRRATKAAIDAVGVSQSALTEARIATQAALKSAEADVGTTRAWIVPPKWKAPQIKDSRFVGGLGLMNAGETPALNVKTTYKVEFTQGSTQTGPRFIERPTKEIPSPGAIPAKTEWGNGIEGDQMTGDQIAMINNCTARVFIHFCITYRDVIIPKEERITEGVYYWPAGKCIKTGMGVDGKSFRIQ